MRERYAADLGLTCEDIAKETGRAVKTIRWHAHQRRWGKRRAEVQAKLVEQARAEMQLELNSFSVSRTRRMLKVASLSIDRMLEVLRDGDAEMDPFKLQAALKAFDDGTVTGKVAEQLTPFLLESLDKDATMRMVEERRADLARLAQQQKPATGSSTTSTQKPACANGRVASSFSRPSGSS